MQDGSYLKQKVADHKLLTKVAGKGDHVGAGLSIILTVGAADSETAVPIHLNIVEDTQKILDLLVSANEKSISLYAKLVESQVKDLQESLACFKASQSQKKLIDICSNRI